MDIYKMNGLIIRLKEMMHDVEIQVLGTPTGKARELLTEAYIHLSEVELKFLEVRKIK